MPSQKTNMLRHKLDTLRIEGFQSIQNLPQLELGNINVLIGPNGAGKSNFVNYFRMVRALINGSLQTWIAQAGGADRVLSFGVKETAQLTTTMKFGQNGYRFILKPTDNDALIFHNEEAYYHNPNYPNPYRVPLGAGHSEANLMVMGKDVTKYCHHAIAGWQVYHFHDTSRTSGVKRYTPLHHQDELDEDAANLADFLYSIKVAYPDEYDYLRRIIQRVVPGFDDFVLNPIARTHPDNLEIRLEWKMRGNNYPLWPTQLSDGSIRFICLATALLQPKPPTTIIIDEPELGLHPSALGLLGGLIRRASANGVQVIIATQSVPFLNEFTLEDIIVTEMKNGISSYKRLNPDDFTHWLEDYSLGDLWVKNILGGRP